MSPDLAVIIVAALPYADKLADKVIADRKAARAHAKKQEREVAK